MMVKLVSRILLFQLGGPIERSRYYALWTLTEVYMLFFTPQNITFILIHSSISLRVPVSSLVLALRASMPMANHNGTALPTLKSCKSSLRPTSSFSLTLGTWKQMYGFVNVCINVSPLKARNPVSRVVWLPSLRVHFGYVFVFVIPSLLDWLFCFLKQHGISSGYYLTFLMGGFITTAARLARSNIRPLLLPPPSNPSASPSLLKRIYDLFGIILSILILNYAASPFILLSASDSLLTWSRLGWYGHIIVMGGLVFFYGGGTKFFMSLQKMKGVSPPSTKVAAAAAAVSVQNGISTPISEKTFTMPPSVDTVIPPRSWSSKKE